jgi:hypothetical protein
MKQSLRHYCRNPRCRMKLQAPVENEHRAFCCRGCFESFYRSRCLVCEEPMRRKTDTIVPSCRLPSNDHCVLDTLAGGGPQRCIVAAMEIGGLFRRRRQISCVRSTEISCVCCTAI